MIVIYHLIMIMGIVLILLAPHIPSWAKAFRNKMEGDSKFLYTVIKIIGLPRFIFKSRLTMDKIRSEINSNKYNHYSVILIDEVEEISRFEDYILPYVIAFNHRANDICLTVYNLYGDKWAEIVWDNQREAYYAFLMMLRSVNKITKRQLNEVLVSTGHSNSTYTYRNVYTYQDREYGKSKMTSDDIGPMLLYHHVIHRGIHYTDARVDKTVTGDMLRDDIAIINKYDSKDIKELTL